VKLNIINKDTKNEQQEIITQKHFGSLPPALCSRDAVERQGR
jgi:hypothetical protein